MPSVNKSIFVFKLFGALMTWLKSVVKALIRLTVSVLSLGGRVEPKITSVLPFKLRYLIARDYLDRYSLNYSYEEAAKLGLSWLPVESLISAGIAKKNTTLTPEFLLSIDRLKVRPKWLAELYFYLGQFDRLLNLEGVKSIKGFASKFQKANDYHTVATEGLNLEVRDFESVTYQKNPEANEVLYLAHSSLPYSSAGYATRTHSLVSRITSIPINVFTRLGFPYDLKIFSEEPKTVKEVYDGVTYNKLLSTNGSYTESPLTPYLKNYISSVIGEIIKNPNISVIHGASNYINGLAANMAAKILGIKSVYEVRGMWHITRASKMKGYEDTFFYRMQEELELKAAREADSVITISEALRSYLVDHGVEYEKITVVPNGVDVEKFESMPVDYELKEKLGVPKNNKVIGYVGSIVSYEGLDILLNAFKKVEEQLGSVSLLIIGDGAQLKELKELAVTLEVNNVIFTGRVPFDEVPRYYSIIDICPFPRKKLPVTELVPPLKPFEAMALDKLVLLSNVGAMKEFVEEGVNGFCFRASDKDSLVAVLRVALSLQKTSHYKPRSWVVRNRSWKNLAEEIEKVYEKVVK